MWLVVSNAEKSKEDEQIADTKKPAFKAGFFVNLVGPGELESPTPAMSRRYSNQLSYGPKFYLS